MNDPDTIPIIQAHHLSVGYDHRHPVIHDFNVRIQAQQFIGIFGSNGAGKTTLLRCLLGLIKPIKGELTVLGKTPICGHPHIGYMPQVLPKLHPSLSSAELLASTVKGHRWGLPFLSHQAKLEIQKVVEFLGAQDLIHRPFMALSGGEQRRLWLAQALLGDPKILLLDEPLANLDMHYQHHLVELLIRIQQMRGVTILLTAHDINPLSHAMTQVLYLASGKAVIGTVAEVINAETLSHLYGSPIEVMQHKGRIFVIHSHTGQIENAVCH